MKCRRYFRDINKRKLFKNTELIQRVNKVLYFSLKINVLKIILLENYSYYFSQVQIKNFCVISGRLMVFIENLRFLEFYYEN